MTKWVPCGNAFETGDVVRWTEGIWHQFRNQRRGKKRKTLKLGSREVTAQVTDCEPSGFLHLCVMKCKVIELKFGKAVEPYKKDAVIRRKGTTIARGGGERMISKASIDPPKKTVSRFQR